jgi:hypothetical protein
MTPVVGTMATRKFVEALKSMNPLRFKARRLSLDYRCYPGLDIDATAPLVLEKLAGLSGDGAHGDRTEPWLTEWRIRTRSTERQVHGPWPPQMPGVMQTRRMRKTVWLS